MRVIIITGGNGDGAGGSFLESSPGGQDGVNSHKHHLCPHYLRVVDYSQPCEKCEHLPKEETRCMNVNMCLLLRPLGRSSIFMSSPQ